MIDFNSIQQHYISHVEHCINLNTLYCQVASKLAIIKKNLNFIRSINDKKFNYKILEFCFKEYVCQKIIIVNRLTKILL